MMSGQTKPYIHIVIYRYLNVLRPPHVLWHTSDLSVCLTFLKYRFFGEPVVKACVENQCHHIDVSGEPEVCCQVFFNKLFSIIFFQTLTVTNPMSFFSFLKQCNTSTMQKLKNLVPWWLALVVLIASQQTWVLFLHKKNSKVFDGA